MKKGTFAFLFYTALIVTIAGCGGSSSKPHGQEGLSLLAPAPDKEKVTSGYSGLATCTAEPSLSVRTGPGWQYPKKAPLPFAATADVTQTRLDSVSGQIYARISQGWVDARWLKMGSFIAPLSRQGAVDICRGAMGYSYWWGGAAFKNGAQRGSCQAESGSDGCPNCTHGGSFGADCSGLISKCWQLPEALPMEENLSPYYTGDFISPGKYWSLIDRSEAKTADALVYRRENSGHIVLVEKGDPWGQLWVYEAKGCKYGIVHNLRSFGEEFKAIRREGWAD